MKKINVYLSVMASAFALHTADVFASKLKTEMYGPSAMASSEPFEMRQRPTEKAEFSAYIDYLVDVADPRSTEQLKEDDVIKKRFKKTMIVDSLWVGGPGFPAGFSAELYDKAMTHSIENNYNVVSATITNAGKPDTPAVVRQRMIDTNKHWADQPEKYLQVRTVDDFYKAKKQGRLGVFHNFQGMMPLSQSGDEQEALANLSEFYELGMRQLMFTYNIDTPYSDGGVSNSDGTDQGVHKAGFAVIKEANRLGIALDCSHSSNQTCIEAATASDKPIMLSHSNADIFQPIDRNASAQAIQAVAASGGVICVNFIGGFLNPQGDASPFQIAKHVEYIRNLTGPEHVCAGSDYVWNYADTLLWILNNPKDFPVEMGYATPSHMGKPSEMWGVARVLKETYNWSDEEIAGFLGENLVRFYNTVWVD
ncbi:dipeptidase [Agaribacterium sp. ZY112]|uniref:dipeptidase n=1 Tax=Agaribacterium sp. ZY112 TaxID=3233574 RepID=UPI0035261C7C